MAEPLLVPVDAKTQDWPRRVANAVNTLLRRTEVSKSFPFEALAAAPASPDEGRTYYDTTLHKARVWDGSVWQNFW